jgi:hypothetical protein
MGLTKAGIRARFRFLARGGFGPAVLQERQIRRMPDDFLGDLVQFRGRYCAGAARLGGARRSRSGSSSCIRPDPTDPATGSVSAAGSG